MSNENTATPAEAARWVAQNIERELHHNPPPSPFGDAAELVANALLDFADCLESGLPDCTCWLSGTHDALNPRCGRNR